MIHDALMTVAVTFLYLSTGVVLAEGIEALSRRCDLRHGFTFRPTPRRAMVVIEILWPAVLVILTAMVMTVLWRRWRDST